MRSNNLGPRVSFQNGLKSGHFQMKAPDLSTGDTYFEVVRGASFIKGTLTVQELRELAAMCLEAAQELESKRRAKETSPKEAGTP